uniref:Uncharacterized protein n=1 Tax=Arundo donax TaxID=35708 RepID=A0A0A9GNI4_ARUDO
MPNQRKHTVNGQLGNYNHTHCKLRLLLVPSSLCNIDDSLTTSYTI